MFTSSSRSRRFGQLWAIVAVLCLACLVIASCANPSLPATGEQTVPPISDPGSTPGASPAEPGSPSDAPSTPGPGADLAMADGLQVHFIDVGQGDAILILAEPGLAVLIDGGPRAAGPVVLNYLSAQGVTSLGLVIATHPHADHIGGLIDVLRNIPVTRVIDSGQPHTSKTFDDYLGAIESQVEAGGCRYEVPESQQVALASNVTLTVLGPKRQMDSLNNNSVVARVDFGETSFLFTGDAEAAAEAALLERDLQADVLKVGHHASRSSTGAAFLAVVSPSHAVLSLGLSNVYGHPHVEVLDRLAAAGVAIYRTDHQGHIVFSSDGSTVRTSSQPWTPAAEPDDSTAPAGLPTGGTGPATQGLLHFGSLKSDRYHFADCRLAGQIVPDNAIWFESADDAADRGYVPCGTCKPPR